MKYVYKYENMKRIDYVYGYVLRFLRYLSFFKTYVYVFILYYYYIYYRCEICQRHEGTKPFFRLRYRRQVGYIII